LPYLKKISFFQFKNYSQQSFEFPESITCICGKNGSGKTNLLDAIYYLGYTKSYFAKKDALVVSYDKQGMFVEGQWTDDNNDLSHGKIIIRENGKKELSVNQISITSIQQHLGNLPCVMIAPDDTAIITEGSEYRRKLMDGILGQIFPEYLNALVQYNKIVTQRNALLKDWHKRSTQEKEVIEIYNLQMQKTASVIIPLRLSFIKEFEVLVSAFVEKIGVHQDTVLTSLKTKVSVDNYATLLQENFEKDIILKRTTIGIHRDDIEFVYSNQQLVKDVGSQGQRKTLLFAIKMAQFHYLKKHLQRTPILLLDDVFEKLDEQRSQSLLNLITEEDCQTFITDTHRERLEKAFMGKNIGIIEIIPS
jgi:DNA replication and repair protein RecF